MSESDIFLREWREYRGLTQEELAEKADTSAGYLSQIERGTRPWSKKWLTRFGKALNVPPDRLLKPPPSLGERAAWYDDENGAPAAMRQPALDVALMRECIRMAYKLARRRNNDDAAADAAADAAIESYFTYHRLKEEEDAA